jgi:Holliday junction resolvase|tara:strand:- start:793 stop:1080 length:288 start_codon:yes stop_codon:yes gene_type:complete
MTGSELQKEVMEYMRANGYLVWKNHNIGVRGRTIGYLKGLPDIFALKHGTFFAIEIKGKGDRLTLDQQNWLNDLTYKGAIAFVAESLKDVMERGL